MRVGIRVKLLTAFSAMLLLAVLVGVVGLINLDSVNGLLTLQYDDHLVPIDNLAQARSDVGTINSGSLRAIIDRPDARATAAVTARAVANVNHLLDQYALTARDTAAERAGLGAYQSHWSAFQVAQRAVLRAAGTTSRASATRVYVAQAGPLFTQVDGDLARLIALNRTQAAAMDAQGDATYASSRTLTIALLLGVLLLGGTVGLLLARSIASAAEQVTRAARGLARGELEQQITVRSRDELGTMAHTFQAMIAYQRTMAGVADAIARGDLAQDVQPQSAQDVLGTALQRMVGNLRTLVGALQQGAHNLGSAGSEILGAAAQQAAGATEQAAAISQTTATVDQVTASAEQAVQMATTVAETAEQASRVAGAGVTAVRDAAGGMADLRTRVQSIAENMLALSEQSQQIGEIITTVGDLADQSNLLALNAAIEASRAGEQGKGFTVVAQEIRTLAEQSKAATAQVRTILSDIQRATNAAVLATEQGAKGADAGAGLIARAGQTIDDLAALIQQAALSATQIAAAVRQHSLGMEQIATAMGDINQATTQNLAATTNTQQAAAHLTDLASHLTHLVADYHV